MKGVAEGSGAGNGHYPRSCSRGIHAGPEQPRKPLVTSISPVRVFHFGWLGISCRTKVEKTNR